MVGEYFYRLTRNFVEALILLAACLWLMPIFLYVFGIQFLDILTIFSFTPFAVSCGIFASKSRSKGLKFLLFLVSAAFAVALSLVFKIGEITMGFGVILSVLFYIKQILLPRYAVPGMRLAPLLVIGCIFFLIASLMFGRPELAQHKWIVDILSIITVFSALSLICCERILMSGWYVNMRIPINKTVKNRNIFYICVFAVLVFIFANFVFALDATTSFSKLLSTGFLYIFGFVFSIFSGAKPDSFIGNPGSISSGSTNVTQGNSSSGGNFFLNFDSEIFIKIIEYLALAIIIAGLTIFIVKLIKSGINTYKNSLSRRKSLIADDDVSDVEDFIDGDKTVLSFPFSPFSIFRRQDKYSDCVDNIERTRFIYRKGLFSVLKDSPKAYTPRDNCKKAVKKGVISEEQSKNLVSAYEKARYGSISPSDEEVNKIKNIL